MAEPRRLLWWLTGGTETCPACLQIYAWEVQLRCAACDGPSCPMCATRVRGVGVVLCPACAAARPGGWGGEES